MSHRNSEGNPLSTEFEWTGHRGSNGTFWITERSDNPATYWRYTQRDGIACLVSSLFFLLVTVVTALGVARQPTINAVIIVPIWFGISSIILIVLGISTLRKVSKEKSQPYHHHHE